MESVESTAVFNAIGENDDAVLQEWLEEPSAEVELTTLFQNASWSFHTVRAVREWDRE